MTTEPEAPEVEEAESTRKMDPEIRQIAQAIRVIEPLSDAAKAYIIGRYTRLRP